METGKLNGEARVSDLVRRYFSAYESRDRKAVEDLLSDDFTFTSPLDDHIDRAAYFSRCWPNSERIRAYRIEKLFESGNEAFIRYECETKAGDRFRNTEWLRFESGRLEEVQVYFGEEARDANGKGMGTPIHTLIDDSVRAPRDKDIDRLVSNHEPDVMLFDVVNGKCKASLI